MFCRSCGKRMTTLKHLKRASTYKKNCNCKITYTGDIENRRKKGRESNRRIRERCLASAVNLGSRWTHSDFEFIKENFLKMTYEEIAIQLGRSRNSVTVRIHRMRDEGILTPLSPD